MRTHPIGMEPSTPPLPDSEGGPRSTWFPEAHFVILCSRTRVSESVARQIRDTAQRTIDWPLVLELARHHGVGPLLYRTICAVCADLVPKESMDALCNLTQTGTLLSQALLEELVQLCCAFSRSGVPIIPFRGATLAASAYGDHGIRHFDHLDFIVRQHRLADAERLLWSQGYRPSDSLPPGDPDRVFVKKNSSIRVALQWTMTHGQFTFHLGRNEIWNRRTSVRINGDFVEAVAPDELLILLCVHGSKHAWEKLKWTVDVAELLRAQSLDWQRILTTATTWKCRRMVLLGLALAHWIFNTPLPPHIRVMLSRDPDILQLAWRMPKGLLASDRDGIDQADAVALYFALKDTWADRWLYGLSLLRDDHPILDRWPVWIRPRLLMWLTPIARAFRASPLVHALISKCRRRIPGLSHEHEHDSSTAS